MLKKKVCIIIPARLGSSRFPNKPLVDIGGKSMIQRVYERCKESFADEVIVSTEDQLIYDHVKEFGRCDLTPKFENGTLRVCHTASSLINEFSHIINVQGDEPFIDLSFLNRFIRDLSDITPGNVLTGAEDNSILSEDQRKNPNAVKFISAKDKFISGFTRSPFFIHISGIYKHIGVYGFCSEDIESISLMETTELSKRDSLEQITWMERGFNIKYTVSYNKSISIDTQEDLSLATSFFLSNK